MKKNYMADPGFPGGGGNAIPKSGGTNHVPLLDPPMNWEVKETLRRKGNKFALPQKQLIQLAFLQITLRILYLLLNLQLLGDHSSICRFLPRCVYDKFISVPYQEILVNLGQVIITHVT